MKESEIMEQPYFAQFGEDRILDEIFGHRKEGQCVEVGANDGINDSMTYHFELSGWNCLLVEPVPDLVQKIIEKRSCIVMNYAASSSDGETSFFVADEASGMSGLALSRWQRKQVVRVGGTLKEIKVRKKRLDDILEEANVMAIDFISIDVEGHELEVLKGFSLRKYNPRIVLIEDNSNQTNFAVQIHMKSNGYELFNRTGVNDWYVKQCDKELFIPEQASAFQEGREKAYIENLLALHLSRYLVHVPESMKSIPKKLIRWMSNAYFKLRGKPRSSIPPGGGRN